MQNIRLGTRASKLALWQANFVKQKLTAAGYPVEIIEISTKGDQNKHLSFDKMEGRGFFTKTLEEALLNHTIDLAVHSHKDLETTSPDGLEIAAVSSREKPNDLLVIRKDAVDNSQKWSLKTSAKVGTSSARRKCQLAAFRPDVQIADLRGNVPTRVRKLSEGQYDAILLAFAGVHRLQLDLGEFETVLLDPSEFIPAPAQGVLGLQIRREDETLKQALLKNVHSAEVKVCVAAEREVLRSYGGGCQLPVGVYCVQRKGRFYIYVNAADDWRKIPVRLSLSGEDPLRLAADAIELIKKKSPLNAL